MKDLLSAPTSHALLALVMLTSLLPLLFLTLQTAQAQTPPAPITSSGLNTVVTTNANLHNITGGTRPGGGTNLFHSFGNFNVPTNNIANFLNSGSVDSVGNPLAAGLPTSNILGRVTAGNPSVIYGMIQTNGTGGFGNANLFLINPAGFLFGPNATINVGGMVAFTTADYLRFDGTQTLFNNASTPGSLSPLSIAPVAAFGFLGSNPAAIAVQGSTLTVAQGQSLSLVGGNKGFTATNPDNGNPINVPDGMTMTGGKLSAPGGQINIASVAGPSEISAVDFIPTPGTTMGNISLSQGTLLDVSADAAGTVRIRGGQFVMDQATISANTANANGAPVAIDINATGDMVISAIDASALMASTTGSGDAGEIHIVSRNLTAQISPTDSLFALIDTHTSGPGRAGKVTIDTGTLDARTDNGGYLIDTGTGAEGNGNDVTITARSVTLNDMNISTGDFRAINSQNFNATGSGGNINISADAINLDVAVLQTQAFQGQAGDVTLTGHDIAMNGSVIGAVGLFGSGALTITANQLTMTNNTQIETETAFAPGRDITITSNVVELTNGSTIRTQTSGPEAAGNIIVTATDHIILSNPTSDGNPSGFYSNSIGVPEVPLDTLGGNAGSIVLTTPHLTMFGGARVDTTTQTSGRGGDITINTTGAISISGELRFPPLNDVFTLGSATAGGLFTRTIGSGEFCTGACGNAGNITINAGSLAVSSGSLIDSGTSSTGRGGNITIHATNTLSLSGTLNDGAPVGIFSRALGIDPQSGSGGNIELHASEFQVANGAQISASTLGPGNAGNVTLEGTASPAQSVLIEGFGSGIFTNTQGTGAGGSIFVNANTVTLQNGGTLSAKTSGTEASATGGTITVEGGQILLSNQASIQASAETNFPANSGSAGNITLLADQSISLLGNSSISSTTNNAGDGGSIRLTAPYIEMQGQSNIGADTAGLGNAGNVLLGANLVVLGDGSRITARTQAEGNAGDITIHGVDGAGSSASEVTLSGNSQLVSETIGDGVNLQGAAGNIRIDTAQLNLSGASLINTASRGSTGAAGNITVNVTDMVTISGSQLLSASTEFSFGDAGHVSVSAPSVIVENGGGISTVTGLVGNAGTITVKTNNLQLLSGGHITSSSVAEFPDIPPSGAAGTVTIQGLTSRAQSIIIDGANSGIFTETQGTGAGGNILVNGNSVTLQNGGTLSAATSGTAPSATGGTITVDANQVQVNSGSLITASTTGAGAGGSANINASSTFSSNAGTVSSTATQATGGDINIVAGQSVTLDNGSLITASSNGAGNAGNIFINAGQMYTSTNSSVTTKAEQASGGNITVLATGLVHLTNSELNASVEGSETTVGGNIIVDPVYVILENSQILAQATQGQGGNINIFYTGALLTDSSSVISASSQFGQSGTVTIQSPISPASGKIVPLGQKPLIVTSLLSQRCAALAGGNISSFTVAGRDMLPAEPGDWLSTPLALGTLSEEKSMEARGERETTLLSLRRIAPPGFLTQTFAMDSSGCTS